jgi:hypothetical protein
LAADVSVDTVMTELHERVHRQLRERLLLHGASTSLADPAVFAEVERLMQSATTLDDAQALLLPELLGDRDSWRLRTSIRFESHRSARSASLVLFVKRRVLMPLLRWLFEYSRDNFERQQRVNHVLFACVQELATENARLRREVEALAHRVPPAPAVKVSDRR